MLLLLMLLYALGNLATALAPSFSGLVAFRFISGLPHGAYFGIAAQTAEALQAATLAPDHVLRGIRL